MAVPNKYLAWRKLPPAPKRNPGTAVQTQKTKSNSNIERIRLFYTGRRIEIQCLEGCHSYRTESTQCRLPGAMTGLERTQQLNSQQWNGTWNLSLYWETLYNKVACQDKKGVRGFGKREVSLPSLELPFHKKFIFNSLSGNRFTRRGQGSRIAPFQLLLHIHTHADTWRLAQDTLLVMEDKLSPIYSCFLIILWACHPPSPSP